MKIHDRRIKALAVVVDAILQRRDVGCIVGARDEYHIEVNLTAKECRDLIDVFAASTGERSFMALSIIQDNAENPKLYKRFDALAKKARAIAFVVLEQK